MNREKSGWVFVIVLSIVILAASVIYLVTGRMVPGLIPFGSAILLIPLYLNYRKMENGKLYSVLFLTASVLNLIAGIFQILNAVN